MRLVKLSVLLFIAVSLIYNRYGKYYDTESFIEEYWAIFYRVPMYFMLFSMIRQFTAFSLQWISRAFFTVMSVFFSLLIVAHLVCLFHMEWYDVIIGYSGKWGWYGVALTVGVLYLNLLKIKIKKKFKDNVTKN
jgi:hypothetical protein